jgi:peroxiredoxin
VDAPFPDITLPALEDGRPLSLRAFRGQKVILHVFASW